MPVTDLLHLYFRLAEQGEGRLEASLRTLSSLRIGPPNWTASCLTPSSKLQPLAEVARKAERLEHISLISPFQLVEGSSEEAGVALPAEVLLANPLHCLTHLMLEDLTLPATSLLEALSRCQQTLRNLDLSYTRLYAAEERWTDVLRLVIAMPQLKSVEISEAMQLYQGVTYTMLLPRLGAETTASNSPKLHLELRDPETIGAELRAALQRGYIMVDDDEVEDDEL